MKAAMAATSSFIGKHADAEGAGARLAVADGGKSQAGRRPAQVHHDHGDHDEDRQREVRETSGRWPGTDGRYTCTPRPCLVEDVPGEDQRVGQQPERQRHQRDVQVAEPDRQQPDDHADRRRRSGPTSSTAASGSIPWLVASCAVPIAPMAAKVAWHSQIMPPSPTTMVKRQEDHRERQSSPEQGQPVAAKQDGQQRDDGDDDDRPEHVAATIRTGSRLPRHPAEDFAASAAALRPDRVVDRAPGGGCLVHLAG